MLMLAALGLLAGHFGWKPAGDTRLAPAAPEPEQEPASKPRVSAESEALRAEGLLQRFLHENNTEALQAASGHARRALELDAESWRAVHANGLVHDARAQYAQAREFFTRIRRIDPANALGYVSAAETFLSEGQLGTALYWLQLGQAAAPTNFDHSGGLVLLNDCLEDYAAAQQWSDWLDRRVTNQPQIMALQARHHYLTGNFEAAVQTSNIAINLSLPGDWRSNSIFMRIKRDEAVATGSPQSGIELFARHHPTLLEDRPHITPANILQAVDLALLLRLAGQQGRADRLTGAAVEAYDQPFFSSGSARAWLIPARAEALAVAGQHEAALTELERIIDDGWRIHWRWETEMNPNFSDIRDRSAFKSLIRRLEADIAEQRAVSLAQAETWICTDCGEILR